MRTVVIATLDVPGFHRWPDAPEQTKYLSANHRHMFHFRAEVQVTHGNRQVELHALQHEMRAILDTLCEHVPFQHSSTPLAYNFGTQSCEQLAELLLGSLANMGFNCIAVECWEDKENGARVERSDA